MLMPDNYEIREDGTLVIIVNEVEYEFKEMDDLDYVFIKEERVTA